MSGNGWRSAGYHILISAEVGIGCGGVGAWVTQQVITQGSIDHRLANGIGTVTQTIVRAILVQELWIGIYHPGSQGSARHPAVITRRGNDRVRDALAITQINRRIHILTHR